MRYFKIYSVTKQIFKKLVFVFSLFKKWLLYLGSKNNIDKHGKYSRIITLVFYTRSEFTIYKISRICYSLTTYYPVYDSQNGKIIFEIIFLCPYSIFPMEFGIEFRDLYLYVLKRVLV